MPVGDSKFSQIFSPSVLFITTFSLAPVPRRPLGLWMASDYREQALTSTWTLCLAWPGLTSHES